MKNKIYSLRYLPIFEQDLTNTINYIAKKLQQNFLMILRSPSSNA